MASMSRMSWMQRLSWTSEGERMMDVILEIVLEVILEGAVDLSTDRKVPLPVRILLAAVLIALYLGLCGALLYLGIREDEPIVILIAVFIFLMCAVAVICKYRQMKKTRR